MEMSSLKKFTLFIYCTLYILTFLVTEISLQDITQHKNWKLLNGEECDESDAFRIIGGDEVEDGQFPWMARLGYVNETLFPTNPIYGCGGSLINENYVITAAHCVFNEFVTLTVVRLGEVDLTVDNQLLENGGWVQEIGIKQIIVHENYNHPRLKHDIALLRLDKPATINSYVTPICLSPERLISEDNLGELVEVIGWGATDMNGQTRSNKLLQVSIPTVPLIDCIENFKHTTQVGEGQLCAGGIKGYDSCKGDSGGPLMKLSFPRYYLIGLVSFGAKECGSTEPAVYTDVYYYSDWILDHIEP